MGSGNGSTLATLDLAQVSYLNGGKIIDFVDAAKWSGGASGNFLNAANWNDNQVPSAARNAVVDRGNATSAVLSLDAGAIANLRSFGAGSGTVNVNLGNGAALTTHDNGFVSAEVGATLHIDGGAVTAAAVEAWGSISLFNSIIALDGGSVNQPVRGGRYGIVVGPGGSLTIGTGADVTVANSSAGTVVRVGEGFGASAILNIESGGALKIGTPTQLGALQVGDFGSTGQVNQSGGLVDVVGSLNIGNRSASIGGSQGIYDLSGGTLRLSGGLYGLGRTVGTDAFAAHGEMKVSGGVLDIVDGGFIIGDRDSTGLQGTGVLSQTGGVVRVGADATLFLAGFGGGTYNLSGGTLEVGGNGLRPTYNNSEPYAFNLGGGTIKVVGSNLTIDESLTLVGNTVSTVDTNGFSAVIQNPFSGPGSLAKTGDGVLIAEQGFVIHSLAVEEGLFIAKGLIEASGEVSINDGAVFNGSGAGSIWCRTVVS